MGMYTECEMTVKHTDGSPLSTSELDQFAEIMSSTGLIWDWSKVYNDDAKAELDWATETTTSLNTEDEVTELILSYTSTHPNVMVQLFIDFDDGENTGYKILFRGTDIEKLRKIITYEEPSRIIW